MFSMSITVIPFSSIETPSTWGKHFVSQNLYGVIETNSLKNDAKEIGIRTISTIARLFIKESTKTNLLEKILYDSFDTSIVSLLGVSIHFPTLQAAVLGGGGLIFKRQQTCSIILSSHGTVTGSLQNKDILIACNASAWNIVLSHGIENIQKIQSIHELIHYCEYLMRSKTESGAAGCLIVCGEIPKEQIKVVEKEKVTSTLVPPKSKLHIFLHNKRLSIHNGMNIKKIKKRTILMYVVGCIFFISIILGIQKEIYDLKSSSYTSSFSKATSLYTEGVALSDSNAKKAKETLDSAKALLSPLLSRYNEHTLEGTSIRELLAKIDAQVVISQKIEKISPSIFYDYTLLKASSSIRFIALFGKTMTLLSTDGSVAQISPITKEATIIGSVSSYGNPIDMTATSDEAYVLVPEGVIEIRNTEKPRIAITHDPEWGTIQNIGYYGGNIYLLDTKHGQIWRYQGQEDGTFPERGEFLNPDTLPDFSTVISMVIDGSIWIWNDEGMISRYSYGKEVSYTPDGVDPALGKRIMVSTDETTNNIYILDKDTARIVVTDKNGIYIRQYPYEQINPTDLLVDETNRRIYLLVDGMVYMAEMK
jgi:hypothetical protein